VYRKLASYMIAVIAALVTLTLFSSSIRADDLVFRNDFICYDTLNTERFDRNSWIDVSLDREGNISQINRTSVPITPWESEKFYQYNRFDKYGNQVLPVTYFMPDTASFDSIWTVDSRVLCYTNEDGLTAVPGEVRLQPASAGKVAAFRFNKYGYVLDHPFCIDCDIPYAYSFGPYVATGDINSTGIIGTVWNTMGLYPKYSDSLYARLYYPASDSVGPRISVYDLPAPVDPSHAREMVRIGVADDSSFVVSWISDMSGRTLFAMFNADGSPRTDIMLADSVGSEWTSELPLGPSRLDMAMEVDGDFYIAIFAHPPTDCAGFAQIYLRGFNADGTPKYNLTRITDTDSTWICNGEYIQPSIDCDDSGNVLVVWSDTRDFPGRHPFGNTPRNVYAQKIDPEGRLVGPNYRINNNPGNTCQYGENSMCDMNNAGQAIILWQNWYGTTPYRVSAQLIPYDDIGTFVPGDLNLDFKGNISDLTYLLTYLFGGQADSINFWPQSLADFNGDGKSGNISDVCYMVSYLFGMPGGPAPHTPDAGIREPLPLIPGSGESTSGQPPTDEPPVYMQPLDEPSLNRNLVPPDSTSLKEE